MIKEFMKNVQFHPEKTWVIDVDAWSPVVEEYRHKYKNKCALENKNIPTDCIGMKP